MADPGLRAAEPEHVGDRAGEAQPGVHLRRELAAARAREAVHLRAAVVAGRLPLGAQPALLLELVERRIQRAVAHGERVARYLPQAEADRVAVQRLERDDLHDQQVQRALDQIGRLAHPVPSVTEWSIPPLRSVIKGRVLRALRYL